MEEPLLGPRGKSSFYFNPALFQIPEDAPADIHSSPIVVESPLSIKERLIFGSPDTSPRSRFVLIDYGRSLERMSGEDWEQLFSKGGQRLSQTTSNESTEDVGSVDVTEPVKRTPDENFLDVGRDENRSCTASPSRRVWPIAIQGLRLDVGTGALDGSNKGEQRIEKRETETQSFIVNLPDEAVTKGKTCLSNVKKHLHRSRTAPAMTVMNANQEHVVDLKRPPLESPTSVVTQAFLGLVVYLAVGVAIYVWKRSEFSGLSTHGFVDALYFCIVTMCTIGYGDITPLTPTAKLFSCAFVLVGFGFIDILLSGMVTYVLDRQETLLLDAMSAGHHEIAKTYVVDIKKGRMRIRMKVALAFGVVIMCIGVGTIVMHIVEKLVWLDAFYLSCMSVTTVGYGDHAFRTVAGRLFASIWLLVSTLAVARSFLYLAEARIDKRHRLIAKWVLQKEMTVGDLVAADLDNDGCVSKSDYVVYKLKEMGKIEEKDILEICRQFNTLDTENSGKITLSFLINLHEASAKQK